MGSLVIIADKQLAVFDRKYVDAGDTITTTMESKIDRYLPTINCNYERELEMGKYTFLLADDVSLEAQVHGRYSVVSKSHISIRGPR